MGSLSLSAQLLRTKMGNKNARQRLEFQDFAYISKNTAFLSRDIVAEYYTDLLEKCPDGQMTTEEFKNIFQLAFPSRPEEKVDKLVGLYHSTQLGCCSTYSAKERLRIIWHRCLIC